MASCNKLPLQADSKDGAAGRRCAFRLGSRPLLASALASVAVHVLVAFQLLSTPSDRSAPPAGAIRVSVRLIAAADRKLNPVAQVAVSSASAASRKPRSAAILPPQPTTAEFDLAAPRRLFKLPRPETTHSEEAAQTHARQAAWQQAAGHDLAIQRQAHERVMEWNQRVSSVIHQSAQPFSCTLDEQVVCAPDVQDSLVSSIAESWQQIRPALVANARFMLRYTANRMVMLEPL